MRLVTWLKESGLLIKNVNETIKKAKIVNIMECY